MLHGLKGSRAKRFQTLAAAGVIGHLIRTWDKGRRTRKVRHTLHDLSYFEWIGPIYFWSEFVPWISIELWRAYEALDEQLRTHMTWEETMPLMIEQIDWQLVWNSGEIVPQLNRIITQANTVLLAKLVIQGVL